MPGQPGSPENLMPPGDDWIVRRFEALERRMTELGPAIQEAVGQPIATLTGLVTTQTKSLHSWDTTYGMAFSASSVYVLSLPPVPVPVGYTRALVLLNGSAGVHGLVINTLGARCRLDISNGDWWSGTRSDYPVFANSYVSSPAFTSWEGAVPAGGALTFSTQVTVGANAAADAYNWVDCGATVLFSRS